MRTLFAWILSAFVLSFSIHAVALADNLPASDSQVEAIPEVVVPPTIDSSTISSEQVSQFVSAYLQILDLLDRRGSELQDAETAAEFQRLERELEAEIFEIVAEVGLTPSDYLQLLALANTDRAFGDRIITQLQELTEQ
ncbi:MAG: DUF4168 domain-containing protein [Cyanobacteria bacterium SID2]|nr:DUF4168 domain-containing protein [Cyanobacteria bacterium SID2]